MNVYSQIICLKHFFQLQNLLVLDLFCCDYRYGSFVDSPPWDRLLFASQTTGPIGLLCNYGCLKLNIMMLDLNTWVSKNLLLFSSPSVVSYQHLGYRSQVSQVSPPRLLVGLWVWGADHRLFGQSLLSGMERFGRRISPPKKDAFQIMGSAW